MVRGRCLIIGIDSCTPTVNDELVIKVFTKEEGYESVLK